MNPLTYEATRDRKAERRKETILCIECGIALALLFILFLI